jgi:hypothetical protein
LSYSDLPQIGIKDKADANVLEQGVVRVCDKHRSLHPWLSGQPVSSGDWLQYRIQPPLGYRRVEVKPKHFAWWLRRLPLMSRGTPVRDYRGRIVKQTEHIAVVRMEIGKGDIQQCADVLMRLWGEYLWYRGLERFYQFRLTSGHRNPWLRWARGDRLKIVKGQMRGWYERKAKPDTSYSSFRRYLRVVMIYSGTASLSRELQNIPLHKAEAGDLLIIGGYPGHTVMLLDEARDAKGRRLFLIGQGYTPAQDLHILVDAKQTHSPWYYLDNQKSLNIAGWSFTPQQLFRLPHVKSTR